ncbi:MAG: metalloregulator ArsR/SmtB family transcription factor [Deltaproteobacteria bacterium]|jgi:DNA-binding transcriptional ArsR family regulator|nr:metalloregulator ArsR/SmtB family transcription factor [Deltaproteobacteria bacterium]MBW2572256.1 metalloregulator ArsR/SmtB family transcription factor [Deltaproteobacteria bacterium]
MKIEPFEIFKVLSVDTRVKIIELLKAQGPLGAKDISAAIGITTAAVSQHLKILKQAGLVRSERKGYWIPYSIDEKAMENCRQLLTEVCTCGCKGTGEFRESERSNLESLKKYEEELRNELSIVKQRLNELESNKM